MNILHRFLSWFRRKPKTCNKPKFSCPRCGQGYFPPRYNRCPECGYLLDEIYIHKSYDHGPSSSKNIKMEKSFDDGGSDGSPSYNMVAGDEAPEYERRDDEG